MRKLIAIAALGVALSGFAVMPVMAQSAERAAVLAACTGSAATENACNAAVARFVAVAKSLPPAQADALLADLVVALADSGAGGSAVIASNAIRSVALEFDNASRGAVALQIAVAVETGQELDPQITQTFASPT